MPDLFDISAQYSNFFFDNPHFVWHDPPMTSAQIQAIHGAFGRFFFNRCGPPRPI